jgi:hypothetical protein
VLFGCLLTEASAQQTIKMDSAKLETLRKAEIEGRAYIEQQSTPGVRMDSSTVYFDDEARHILSDTTYRDSVYRQPYTWLRVVDALKSGNVRLGVYQMINLYPSDKAMVVELVGAYDQVIPVEKLVNAAFYTYALLDPRITRIENGKPLIHRPDLMEELFRYANEISAYVVAARSKQPATAPPRQQK